MKHNAYSIFLLSGLLTFCAGISHGDDTDIYLGEHSAGGSTIRPNVLFIMDTSGSMSANVDGTGKDRLDNMKEALNLILDNVNNVNVGLMRFTDPGGPILFPVSYINEDVQVATSSNPPGMDINVRIAESADDAEEMDVLVEEHSRDHEVVLDRVSLDERADAAGGAVLAEHEAAPVRGAVERGVEPPDVIEEQEGDRAQ